MQFANEGDLGKPSLERRDMEHGLPGYKEVENIIPTPRRDGRPLYYRVPEDKRINAELSIKYGIRYLFQRRLVFEHVGEGKNQKLSVVNMRPWEETIERYNGGGDPYYMHKFREKVPVRERPQKYKTQRR